MHSNEHAVLRRVRAFTSVHRLAKPKHLTQETVPVLLPLVCKPITSHAFNPMYTHLHKVQRLVSLPAMKDPLTRVSFQIRFPDFLAEYPSVGINFKR